MTCNPRRNDMIGSNDRCEHGNDIGSICNSCNIINKFELVLVEELVPAEDERPSVVDLADVKLTSKGRRLLETGMTVDRFSRMTIGQFNRMYYPNKPSPEVEPAVPVDIPKEAWLRRDKEVTQIYVATVTTVDGKRKKLKSSFPVHVVEAGYCNDALRIKDTKRTLRSFLREDIRSILLSTYIEFNK